MDFEKTEGIVVKGFNYQDNKRIFTLFTEKGLLSCIATTSERQPEKLLITTPLSRGEFFYLTSSASLKKIKDASLISSYLFYNKTYTLLEAASLCVQAVTLSQIENKPAPLLYKLLTIYLEKITSFQDPKLISSSFMLKTLRHEGVFCLDQLCHICEKHKCQAFFDQRPYCLSCKVEPCIFFEEEEWLKVQILLYGKDLKFLATLECDTSLHEKIKKLFMDFFR